jgi:alpha-L-fucosidase 2
MEQRFWAGARLIFILMSAAALCLAARAAESEFKLTYDKPAAQWTEALPVGNGRIGAMVFGGVEDERLQINEGSLWGGNPHDYANPDTHAQLDQIRQLIFAGKVDEAERLSAKFMGQPRVLMPYQPFCDLRLNFNAHQDAADYGANFGWMMRRQRRATRPPG